VCIKIVSALIGEILIVGLLARKCEFEIHQIFIKNGGRAI